VYNQDENLYRYTSKFYYTVPICEVTHEMLRCEYSWKTSLTAPYR